MFEPCTLFGHLFHAIAALLFAAGLTFLWHALLKKNADSSVEPEILVEAAIVGVLEGALVSILACILGH